MTVSARNFRSAENKLLRLYSLWHETHRLDVQTQCLDLLGKMQRVHPAFNLRQRFQIAF